MRAALKEATEWGEGGGGVDLDGPSWLYVLSKTCVGARNCIEALMFARAHAGCFRERVNQELWKMQDWGTTPGPSSAVLFSPDLLFLRYFPILDFLFFRGPTVETASHCRAG